MQRLGTDGRRGSSNQPATDNQPYAEDARALVSGYYRLEDLTRPTNAVNSG